jgi:hypothetical protein
VTPLPRDWRSYGDDPLPTPAEAMAEPLAAFPSWFMRIECDRCGKVRMISETQRAMLIRDIITKMRHEGCGGRAGKAELITGIEGASSIHSTGCARHRSRDRPATTVRHGQAHRSDAETR